MTVRHMCWLGNQSSIQWQQRSIECWVALYWLVCPPLSCVTKSHRGASIQRLWMMRGLCNTQLRNQNRVCVCVCVCVSVCLCVCVWDWGWVTQALILQMLLVLNNLMCWPAGGSSFCLCHFLCLSPIQSLPQLASLLYIILSHDRTVFGIFVPPFLGHLRVPSTSEGIHWSRGRHNRISVFVSDSCLSENASPPQPLLYLGGCYREGRWLITINRTEREWARGPRTPTNRTNAAQNQGNGRPLLGERKDSFMAKQSWFPHPTSSRSRPLVPRSGDRALNLLVGGQMVNGPHRLYSWTQATLTQSDLAGLNHTLSCPAYEEREQKVLKPRPSAKNRSTLVAHRKRVAAQ